MTTSKFETGNIYAKDSIVDSQSKTPYICIGRTAKTVTFEKYQQPGQKYTFRIKEYSGSEYVLFGSYSMAPAIYADKIIG